jgi:predicted RNA-binding protein with PUA-like domain
MPRYWLFKSEPSCFSFHDLENAADRRTGWDGIRNYQARNFLRDDVKYGDGVIYYHSNAEPPGIAGIAVVVEEAHADPTQFDAKQDHYDPKSNPNSPTWVQVSIEAIAPVSPEVGLPTLRKNPKLEGLELLRTGSRLSVLPVSPEHWQELLRMAGFTEDPHAQWLEHHGLDTGGAIKETGTTSKPSTQKTTSVKAKPSEAAKSTKVKTAVIEVKSKPSSETAKKTAKSATTKKSGKSGH